MVRQRRAQSMDWLTSGAEMRLTLQEGQLGRGPPPGVRAPLAHQPDPALPLPCHRGKSKRGAESGWGLWCVSWILAFPWPLGSAPAVIPSLFCSSQSSACFKAQFKCLFFSPTPSWFQKGNSLGMCHFESHPPWHFAYISNLLCIPRGLGFHLVEFTSVDYRLWERVETIFSFDAKNNSLLKNYHGDTHSKIFLNEPKSYSAKDWVGWRRGGGGVEGFYFFWKLPATLGTQRS